MTVVVEVAEVRPHAGERFALLGEADAGHQSDLLEGAVAVVAEEERLNRIVGHVHVDESVSVVVRKRDAQPLARGRRDGRLRRHVGERAVAVVAIQDIRNRIEVVRVAVRPVAGLLLPAITVLLEAPVEVAGDEQVELPVVVVIEEARACAPATALDACAIRHVGKRSVAHVPVQGVAAEIGHIDILQAVVVVVTHGRAHPVLILRRSAHAGFLSHIDEGAGAGLPIQAVPECRVRFVRQFSLDHLVVELRAVRKEDVQPAVVVIVQEGHPAAHGLQEVPAGRRRVPVLELDAGGLGGVHEPDLRCRRPRRRRQVHAHHDREDLERGESIRRPRARAHDWRNLRLVTIPLPS